MAQKREVQGQVLDERGLPPGYQLHAELETTPRQVARQRKAGEPMVLVDCRTPAEYATARIDGAVLVPLQEAAQRQGELEKYRDEPVVVVCHHGVRSLRMTVWLRGLGFGDVRSMAGGIDLWSRDVDPTVPRY
ncbi:MAG: rhodanese-like domain-containing protein [Phycisphaeraceae bacterium]